MIGVSSLYFIAGVTFLAFALLGVVDRASPHRWGNSAFWGLMAVSMFFGDRLGDVGNGFLVLALVAVAASGRMGPAARRPVGEGDAERPRGGNRLFLIALIIPLTAVVGSLLFARRPDLVVAKDATLVALTAGVLIALAVGCIWLRARPIEAFDAGRRMADSISWAGILPQLLASLGAIFAAAGVGAVVGDLVGMTIPNGSVIGAVIAYGVGMALFTMVMGNAFAAFPVMFAGIGLPILIHQHHGNPAVVAAVGMLCGFCGTLMTPMAANFNIVPAALLELRNRNAVVWAQVPTAVPLLIVNMMILYWGAFR